MKITNYRPVTIKKTRRTRKRHQGETETLIAVRLSRLTLTVPHGIGKKPLPQKDCDYALSWFPIKRYKSSWNQIPSVKVTIIHGNAKSFGGFLRIYPQKTSFHVQIGDSQRENWENGLFQQHQLEEYDYTFCKDCEEWLEDMEMTAEAERFSRR